MTKFIKTNRLAFCNLECPISATGEKRKKLFAFKCDPGMASGLVSSGFNMFSIANNHTFDCGEKGLQETKQFIEKNGFFAAGAGSNATEAMKPRMININGLKIAFFAFTDIPVDLGKKEAGSSQPAMCSREEVLMEIKKARSKFDVVIISYHWGEEYMRRPYLYQKQLAHDMIDNGADLIIGHHPHVIQGIEKYKNKFIIYSIGNYIFDQKSDEETESFIFCCEFKQGGVYNPYLIPVKIYNCQPDFAHGKEFNKISNKIMKLSKGFNVKFINQANGLIVE
jgi:poly-gamma-glutamate synthesis protein (capsule biosynthesis protein)